MKGKKFICAAVAVALTMGVSLSTAGCIVTNNEEDVKQIVATVDISKNEQFQEEFGDYSSAITEDSFVKRDMLVAFFNGYYQYVQSYGYTMAQTFELIKDALVQNAVITQYATAALLKEKVADPDSGVTLAKFNSLETQKARYEYLLREESVKKANYQLCLSLNNTLDSTEKSQQLDDYEGSGTRSTPTGVDTAKDDYVPEHYAVYTGYDGYLLTDPEMAKAVENGDYEPQNGTDRNTRRKAYASFVSSLKSNYLLTAEDVETTDIMQLSYVQDAYITQLQQMVIEEYNEKFEEKQEAIITHVENGIYTYIQNQYDGAEDGMLTAQEKLYSTVSTFETDMGNMSDTSFILYAPSTEGDTIEKDGTYGTYGYVYNILLPFSSVQNITLKSLQSYRDNDVIDESGYFHSRNELLRGIRTIDQREAWFNGETQYAFNVADYNKEAEKTISYFNNGNADRTYLFFENNLTKTDKYEELDKYIGLYSYNGKVTENTDGSYKLVPNKLDIDDMLSEFAAYINYVLGGDSVTYAAGDKLTGGNDFGAYYDVTDFTKNGGAEIDYSKLVYATGKVTFNDGARENMFVTSSDRYKAMAAVNELQYAYTTDTGVLSQYIGYTVSAYDTSYIAEFEYAAQEALRMGAGAFKVCAGDYGWHLLYV
ncbi:MAG: hypothetical protein K2L72_05740, partial [Clostridia bacterium]|nr:hypothetical protein [Clostridia bacterium]